MTRREFVRTYEGASVDSLICFCNEEGAYDLYEEFVTDDSLDEIMNSRLHDMVRESPWYDIRDHLNDIPQGYEWYRVDPFDGEIYGCDDDDAERLYNDIIEYFDNNGLWSEEEEEEECDDSCEEVDDEFDEEVEEFNLIEMIQSNAHIMSA